MITIGNHLKMNVPRRLRPQTRAFYEGVLECRPAPSPMSDLDLYEFAGGFVLGLFFVADEETLPDADYAKATWMEIKAADPEKLKLRLQAFGVKEIDYPDKTRFFFQAPGGQIFRLAPMDGGL